jgi:hypothetical protein
MPDSIALYFIPAGDTKSAAWFGGSALMGILYEKSITVLIGFSVAMQLLSLPIFLVRETASAPITLSSQSPALICRSY